MRSNPALMADEASARGKELQLGWLEDGVQNFAWSTGCILRKHGYPPDKQEKATATVLEQAEVLCEAWA